MAEELFIPKLGQTVEEVTLINWLVKEGDKVEQGQEVLEVETDKAVFNVEAPDSGFIHLGSYKAGDLVPVLTVVGIIGEKGDVFTAPVPSNQTETASAAQTPTLTIQETKVDAAESELLEIKKHFASPRARKLAKLKDIDLTLIKPSGGQGVRVRETDVLEYLNHEIKARPLAKRMAEDAGLDLARIKGSGEHGEITKMDVENALKSKLSSPSTPLAQPTTLADIAVSNRVALKGVRGLIAERMGASVHTTARVTLFIEVDATAFVDLREKLKAQVEREWGFAPGYNELLAKACACALRRFPYMNARINGDVIEHLSQVNIGIAVDAERGLFVPVIKDADQKDLKILGREFRQRVEEIRSNKILPENLSGGTFTITNLGMFDIDGFTPVINLPEAAILGIGRIAPKPVVKENEILIRKMLVLSLVFDHRVVDGAPAAKFLQFLKDLVVSPNEVTLTK